MILKAIDRRRQPALGVANELDAILLSSHVGPSASTGQALAYVYGRETPADADTAKVPTIDEARRGASDIAKLPNYLAANPDGISE